MSAIAVQAKDFSARFPTITVSNEVIIMEGINDISSGASAEAGAASGGLMR